MKDFELSIRGMTDTAEIMELQTNTFQKLKQLGKEIIDIENSLLDIEGYWAVALYILQIRSKANLQLELLKSNT